MQKVDRLCDVFSKAKYDLESAFHHEEREHKIKHTRNEIEKNKDKLVKIVSLWLKAAI